MHSILAVAAGGAIGSVLRYLWSRAPVADGFPWTVLGINVAGSFVLGAFVAIAGHRFPVSEETRAFVSIGLLGGFTTFSTFSHQTIALWQAERFGLASWNVILNVLAGLFAAWLGWRVGRLV